MSRRWALTALAGAQGLTLYAALVLPSAPHLWVMLVGGFLAGAAVTGLTAIAVGALERGQR